MNIVYPPRPMPARLEIPSFSKYETTYEVDLVHGSCSCPSFQYHHSKTGGECKHLRLAKTGAPLDKAERGMLADSTRVLILDSCDHQSLDRTWGFEAGEWEHVLCYDGTRFLRDSIRHGNTLTIQTVEIFDWWEWTRHIPLHRNTRRTTKTKGAAA